MQRDTIASMGYERPECAEAWGGGEAEAEEEEEEEEEEELEG